MDLLPRFPEPPVIAGDRDLRRRAAAIPCDVCGAPMQEHHCKLTCHACGFMRDCSDP